MQTEEEKKQAEEKAEEMKGLSSPVKETLRSGQGGQVVLRAGQPPCVHDPAERHELRDESI